MFHFSHAARPSLASSVTARLHMAVLVLATLSMLLLSADSVQNPAVRRLSDKRVVLTSKDFNEYDKYSGPLDLTDLGADLSIQVYPKTLALWGDVHIEGSFDCSERLRVYGNLVVDGDAEFDAMDADDVYVTGNLTITDGRLLCKNAYVGGDLLAGPATVIDVEGTLMADSIGAPAAIRAGEIVAGSGGITCLGWLSSNGGAIYSHGDIQAYDIWCEGDLTSAYGECRATEGGVYVTGSIYAGKALAAGNYITCSGTITCGGNIIAGYGISDSRFGTADITCKQLISGNVLLGKLAEPASD
jgi:hypothetical protein